VPYAWARRPGQCSGLGRAGADGGEPAQRGAPAMIHPLRMRPARPLEPTLDVSAWGPPAKRWTPAAASARVGGGMTVVRRVLPG
jgi:hypothetical protein